MLRKKEYDFGVHIGYIFMFIIFSTILYFLLKILGKLPTNWNYFNIFLITLPLVFIGKIIKYWLERF